MMFVNSQCSVCSVLYVGKTKTNTVRGQEGEVWLVGNCRLSITYVLSRNIFQKLFYFRSFFFWKEKNTAQGEDFTFTICVILVKFSSCFFSVSNNLQAEGQHYLCGGDGTVYKQSYRQSRGESTQERHKEETFESTK